MNEPITKILCKKYYKSPGRKLFGEYHVGKYYDKFILETEEFQKLTPIPYTYKYIYIYNKNGTGGIRFHLNKDKPENIIFPCFYDYFYDNQEIRRMKLKKLSQIF